MLSSEGSIKLSRWGIILLVLLVGFQIVAAQSQFAPGDKVIFVAPSSPVYTSATATETNAGEISLGTVSRVLSISEAEGRIYLIESAYGWVDATIDGQPSLVPFDEATLNQIEEQAKSAIAADPNAIAAYVAAAMVANNSDRNSEAIDLLSRALEQTPNEGYLLYQRGGVYMDMQQWDEALIDFQEALSYNYEIAAVYNRMAVVYDGLRQYDDAREQLSEAILLAPDWGLLYANLGNQWLNVQDYETALAQYTLALQYDPRLARAYDGRGITYLRIDDLSQALQDFKQETVLEPWNGRGRYNLAYVYSLLGQYASAVSEYTQLIELRNGFAFSALIYRAQNYIALEDYDRAIEDLDEYTNTWSYDILDRDAAIGYMLFAACYAYKGDFDSAANKLWEAIDVVPTFGTDIYEIEGRYHIIPPRYQLMADLQQRSASQPEEPKLLLQLAQVSLELGLWQQARDNFKAYIALSGSNSDFAELITVLEELTG